jgi:hypothetical protein
MSNKVLSAPSKNPCALFVAVLAISTAVYAFSTPLCALPALVRALSAVVRTLCQPTYVPPTIIFTTALWLLAGQGI